MNKHLTVLLLLYSCICASYAGGNFTRGYIITNSNDTIKGWINYSTDGKNAQSCCFKQDLNEQEDIFLPTEIAGYRLEDAGKFFVSKSVVINGLSKALFLEFLVKGSMNLYYYQDFYDKSSKFNSFTQFEEFENAGYYFFEKESGELITLKKSPDKIIVLDNGTERKIEDNKYRGVFNYIFKDFQPLKEKAIRSNFTHKDMIGLTKEYHQLTCSSGEDCIEFETNPRQQRLKFNFSTYAGIDFFKYSRGHFRLLPSAATQGTSPMLGGQINLSFPRWKKSISLQADLSMTKLHMSTTFMNISYISATHPDGYKVENLEHIFNAYSLNNNIGLKYAAQQGLLRPTFETGLFNQRTFDGKERLDINYINSEKTDRIHRNNYSQFERKSTNNFGYYFAAGMDFPLKNKDLILFRINRENLKAQNDWRIKLGYAF